jgi:hypothetical protein
VNGEWGEAEVCVDWHTPGPAGIVVRGEMWRSYPHLVRREIGVITGRTSSYPHCPHHYNKDGRSLPIQERNVWTS